MPLKPWELISSTLNKSFRVFNIRTDRSVSPRTNKEHDFYIMESSDWVNVIPITPQNEVLLVRQFRHGIKEITLEIPGGIVEKGDAPIETARKELSEETGYRSAEMILLGDVHPNPAGRSSIVLTIKTVCSTAEIFTTSISKTISKLSSGG